MTSRWMPEDIEAAIARNPDLEYVNRGYYPDKANPAAAIAHLPPEKLAELRKEIGLPKGNKYHAVRTWSELCQRTFDSKAEAARGEELYFRQKAGEISDLRYQVAFSLCSDPKISVTIDFSYNQPAWDMHKSGSQPNEIYEDVKGILTRDSRTKYAWLKQQYKIDVRLIR